MTTIKLAIILATTMAAVAFGLLATACSSPQEEMPPEPMTTPVEHIERLEAPEPGEPLEPSAPAGTDDALAPEAAEEALATDDGVSPFTPQERPYANSPYAEAIDTGLIFMAENVDNHHFCDWTDYTVLDYLHRKFELDPWFAALELVDVDSLHDQQAAFATLHARMVLPDFDLEAAQVPFELAGLFSDFDPAPDEPFITPATFKHLPEGPLQIILRAMYCDEEPVTEFFGSDLVRSVRTAKYLGEPNNVAGSVVATMILAWQWMRELGCADALQSLENAEEYFPDILVEIVEDQGVITSLGIQAVALLYYIGHDERVRDEWVAEIANVQLPDGAWDHAAGTGEPSRSTCRATAFALWVLLENALPQAENIPWIR